MEEEAVQNKKESDERYQKLVQAFLMVEHELDQLKTEGFNIKHDMLKAIDHNKKKKIIDFINKL